MTRTRGLLPVLIGALAALMACAAPPVAVRAPGRIAQALEVVGDLGASAVLVPKGGDALEAVALERGDDGVTFTGFLPAEPGSYTLEIVFTGVPDGGERHFLGRLVSDAFTVARGATTTPEFNTPVDLFGRDGEGGDDDEDGLAFLDELLLGTDPEAADSDNDGVADGSDCAPGNPGDAFEILEGGNVEDCDADDFRAVNAPLGDPGNDCDDRNADIHPGVEDDCGTVVDQDCNPSTCPVDDSDGPSITFVAPADGAELGCHARAVATITDPSTVQSAVVQLPASPFQGGTPRNITMVQDADDDELWTSLDVTIGGNITDGVQPLVVRAVDGVGNAGTAQRDVSFTFAFPEVTWSGPHAITGAPIDVTLTPAGPRPLVQLELRASPIGELNLVDGSTWEVVGELDTAGGSIAIDPADLTDGTVVWAFASDDIGNASTIAANALFDANGAVSAHWPCEPTTSHAVPAALYQQGNAPFSFRDKLDEATTIMEGVSPDHNLVKIIGFGMRDDGRFDPSAPGFGRFVCFYFNEPHVPPQDPNDDDEGKSVCYWGISTALESPYLNEHDGSLFSDVPIPNVDQLLDSTELAAAWPCVEQMDGSDEDTILIIPNDTATTVYAHMYTETTTWSADPYTGDEIFACDPQ